MAWLVEKNYHGPGPNFEITANPGNLKLINNIGICTHLPWQPVPEPVVARQDKAYRGKIDDMTIVAGSVAVSQRFRDLVEEFEPGVHAFSSLILERKNGERFEEDYWLWTTQQDIDCLITNNDPKNFRYIPGFEPEETRIRCRLYQPGWEVPISRPQIEGRHLWTAGLLGLSQLFVSNAFMDAMRKTLRGYISSYDRCIEVDRPWFAEEQMGPLLPRHLAYVASGRTQVDLTLGEIWAN
jgi:hypothetical protein